MGQKIMPTGFRLGITEDWRSRWYSDKDYAKNLENDLAIRRFLDKHLAKACLLYTSYPLPQYGELTATEEVCEHCGAPMVIVKTARGPWKLCPNFNCPGKEKEAEEKEAKAAAKKAAAKTKPAAKKTASKKTASKKASDTK